MPRLNSSGGYAMGVAGIQGSVNGVLIPDSYGPWWYNDNEVVFAQQSDGTLKIMNIFTGVRRDASSNPSNEYKAGGNNWAQWANIPGIGLFAPNLHLPEAGLKDVGPNGAIAFTPNYQVGIGTDVIELSGERWTLASGIEYDVQLLGYKKAIWRDQFFKIRTFGIPPCIQIGNVYRPRATVINGEWWVCYWSDKIGLVLHPFNSTIGYKIVPPETDAFGHDTVALGNIEKVVWSTMAGEAPDQYREKLIDVTVDARQELASTNPVEPIVALNRPHWLGFFTGKPGVSGGWDTNDDPLEFQNVHALPGNGYLDVPTFTFYNDRDEPIGSFIHQQPGWTVETVEEAARNTPYTPIAYWDSRNWPRWPNLPANSWLCLQAYCKRDESFSAFEADIRAKLIDLHQNKPQQKIAIIAQAFWQTPVNGNTDDLSGLVPIFSRLAAEFPNVIATIPFNGNGRFNGMQQHPEIRPLWEQFAAGITGEPDNMTDVKIPQKVKDNINALYQLHKDLSEGTDDQRRELMKLICEQNRFDLGFKHGWKSADKNRPPSKDAIGYSETGDDSQGVYIADCFNGITREPSIPEYYELSNQHFIPVDPVNHLGNVDPVVGKIDIIAFDPVCRRSNPAGCLIRFDIQSPNPVTEAEFDLEGDGEPGIKVMFSEEVARDGRYVRGFAFKFTVNGQWVLRVTAKDNKGNVYQSDGKQLIEVTF